MIKYFHNAFSGRFFEMTFDFAGGGGGICVWELSHKNVKNTIRMRAPHRYEACQKLETCFSLPFSLSLPPVLPPDCLSVCGLSVPLFLSPSLPLTFPLSLSLFEILSPLTRSCNWLNMGLSFVLIEVYVVPMREKMGSWKSSFVKKSRNRSSR